MNLKIKYLRTIIRLRIEWSKWVIRCKWDWEDFKWGIQSTWEELKFSVYTLFRYMRLKRRFYLHKKGVKHMDEFDSDLNMLTSNGYNIILSGPIGVEYNNYVYFLRHYLHMEDELTEMKSPNKEKYLHLMEKNRKSNKIFI